MRGLQTGRLEAGHSLNKGAGAKGSTRKMKVGLAELKLSSYTSEEKT
jgi:hypothetical protein